MAKSNPRKKVVAAKVTKPKVTKAKRPVRKVVAAKSKSVKSAVKPKKRKAVAAKSKSVKSVAKPVAAKAPVKAAAKTVKSSLAFAKTNKPVAPMRPRPLSPHLSIYRPQITSVLSILHRATGVVLYLGAFVLAALIVCLGYGEVCFGASLALFNSTLGCVALYGFIFCLFYHLCNGIRHLAWDLGEGFELCTVTLSGFLVLIASLSLTLTIWFILHPQFLNQIRP